MFLFSFSISCFVVQSSDFFLVIFISSASAASVIIVVFLLSELFVFLSHVCLMLFPCSLHLPRCDIWSATLISIHLFFIILPHSIHSSFSFLLTKFTESTLLCFSYFKLQLSSTVTSSSLPQLHTGLFSLTLLESMSLIFLPSSLHSAEP